MQSMETRLRQRLSELMSREEQITGDLRQESGALSSDWEEQAQDLENSEVLAALDVHNREEISQIQSALQRLKAGTFGICARCEEAIPEGRLNALPYTTLCVACASGKTD
jgi:RNA polymerase-binding transcription factor DksA